MRLNLFGSVLIFSFLLCNKTAFAAATNHLRQLDSETSETEPPHNEKRKLNKYKIDELKSSDRCKKCSALGLCSKVFNEYGHCDKYANCGGYAMCNESAMPNCDCTNKNGNKITGCKIPRNKDGRLLPKFCTQRVPKPNLFEGNNEYYLDRAFCMKDDDDCNLCEPGRFCRTDDGDRLCIHPDDYEENECKCVNWRNKRNKCNNKNNSVAPPETALEKQVDLSEFGYSHTWPSEEGWFVACSFVKRNNDVYYYNTGKLNSLEDCANFCSRKKSPGGSFFPEINRCFCEKVLECLEPVILERNGIVFSKQRKPQICTESYCDCIPDTEEYCATSERKPGFM